MHQTLAKVPVPVAPKFDDGWQLLVRHTGGIEATRAAAMHHQALAQAALAPLPESDALSALNQMAEKAVDRQA